MNCRPRFAPRFCSTFLLLLASLAGCGSLFAAELSTNLPAAFPIPSLSLDTNATQMKLAGLFPQVPAPAATNAPIPAPAPPIPLVRSVPPPSPLLPRLLPFTVALTGPLVAGFLAVFFCRKSCRRQVRPPWMLSPLLALLGLVAAWLAFRYVGFAGSQPPALLPTVEALSLIATALVSVCGVKFYRDQFLTPLHRPASVPLPLPKAPRSRDDDTPIPAPDPPPVPAEHTPFIRLLEVLLVLYVLYESGVLFLPYWLWKTPPLASLQIGWAPWSEWLYYWLRQFIALGILAYIFYRNSRGSHPGGSVGRGGLTAAVPETASNPASIRAGKATPIVELSLVILTAFGCSIFWSLSVLPGGEPVPEDPGWTVSSLTHLREMGDELAALGLLGYVLHRNSQRFRDLGLHWTSRDAATALPLFLAGLVLYRFYSPLVVGASEAVAGHELELPDVSRLLYGNEIVLVVVLSDILVGFFEELIVRAYLITAMLRLTNSRVLAIIVSVGVQTSYHFYQGVPLGLSHIAMFLLFSLYYVKTRRILPVILAHSLVDLGSLWHHTLYPAATQ